MLISNFVNLLSCLFRFFLLLLHYAIHVCSAFGNEFWTSNNFSWKIRLSEEDITKLSYEGCGIVMYFKLNLLMWITGAYMYVISIKLPSTLLYLSLPLKEPLCFDKNQFLRSKLLKRKPENKKKLFFGHSNN